MARTVRHKVFQFSELNKAAKAKAEQSILIIAIHYYEEQFGIPIAVGSPSLSEWKEEHFKISDYEFTQEGNIFFK